MKLQAGANELSLALRLHLLSIYLIRIVAMVKSSRSLEASCYLRDVTTQQAETRTLVQPRHSPTA